MATLNLIGIATRTFVDLDLNFNIHPIKKDINVYKGEYAVINSVKNLVLTNFYERPFQPQLGSNVRKLLFDNVDTVVALQLDRAIEETILNNEPRVSISKLITTPIPDENKYSVYLEFFVVNNSSPITIDFFLERIR